MPITTIEGPRYLVVRPGDRGYDEIHEHFPEVPREVVYTLVSGKMPQDIDLDCRSFLVARYVLDGIIHDQECVVTNGQADADVFFEDCRILGIQRIHALAHLLLASIGDYTDECHVTDRAFEDKNGKFYLAFSAELNIDKLHILVDKIWQSLNALLKKGKIEGVVAQLFDRNIEAAK